MEQLKYTVADRTIAYLLGINNFINDESAILELIKNAYDAGTTILNLYFDLDCISIEDFGSGMDHDAIKKDWMNVGESHKGYSVIDDEGRERVVAGEKGVGRFALARLGKSIILHSKKKNSRGVCWKTDWESSYLSYDDSLVKNGTLIEIKDLYSKWNKDRINKLCGFINKSYIDDKMKINFYFRGEKLDLAIKKQIEVGVNCTSKIKVQYYAEDNTISIDIESDEFQDEASFYTKESINSKHESVDALLECSSRFSRQIPTEEMKRKLNELGDFSADLYFVVKHKDKDREKYLYKDTNLPDPLTDYGIVIYRNAFSLISYDWRRDWLGLGKRSRQSPAAASHPTGAWRVRENQLYGTVLIDKKTNKVLKDLSNRQGLEEDDYYELFSSILITGISVFERYRQGIIRDINKKNFQEEIVNTSIIDMLINNPQKVLDVSAAELATQLVSELEGFKNSYEEKYSLFESRTKQLEYDVRILNVLATIGLKASSIAHEFKNDRNKIVNNLSFAIDALKKYGFYEELESPQYTEAYYKNVPWLIESYDSSSKKLGAFIDTMLTDIEKERFRIEEINVYEEIKSLIDIWSGDYRWVSIILRMNHNIVFPLSSDIIQVVFDNLILNSVQQNENKTHLTIDISITVDKNSLIIEYKDDGNGLNEKYKSNPRRILEVHETTRLNGHGLGMWIINNTIAMTKGEVLEIGTGKGFYIKMIINGLRGIHE